MDDETRDYLAAMEVRLARDREAMEERLMARMNNNQENLLDRFKLNESAFMALTTAVAALGELERSNNTMLTTLVGLMTDFARRVTDLEKKT